jgi:hypothetical protein
MHNWQTPVLGVAVAALVMASGCGPRTPAPPMETTGKNQVVFDVPGMT